jgi:DNA-binding beta-propeller fold protein YncE
MKPPRPKPRIPRLKPLCSHLSLPGLSLLAVLTLNTSTAHATPITLEKEIGTSGSGQLQRPGGVAVNQTTNDIYVTDLNGNRIIEYDPAGEPILTLGKDVNQSTGENICTLASGDTCGPGEPGAGPGEFSAPSGIAVDQETQDIYVTDLGDRIQKFDAEGHYISQITSSTPPNPTFYLPNYRPSIAVDGEGNLLALDEEEGGLGGPVRVLQFNSTGALTGLSFGPHLLGTEILTDAVSVAVDEHGDVYVAREAQPVVKFSPTGEALGALAGTVNGRVVAVDPLSGSVFVSAPKGREDEVVELSAEGTEVTSFGPVTREQVGGMAYDVDEGKLYVSDDELDRVSVFGGFGVPAAGAPLVEGESVGGLSQSAVTLVGKVDPRGLEASYYFQYGTGVGLEGAGVVPASPGVIGAGRFSGVKVSAVAGLQPSTVYYYRLVAHSAFGGGLGSTTYGATQSFTSPALAASVVTGGASAVTQSSASLSGTVTPGSVGAASDTRWCFQYGTGTGYEQGSVPLSAGDAGEGTAGVPVSVQLTGLWPATLYHYRLVAVNSLGLGFGAPVCDTLGGVQSAGADETFSTGATPPPSVVTGSASEVSSTSAVLSGTVDGYGTQTTYEFDLGTDTTYGARILGDAGAAGGVVPFTLSVQGLQPGETYHYRLAASNAAGESDGTDETFTTPTVPGAVITAPLSEPLLRTPILKFPKETTGTHAPVALTNAQKLKKALKACAGKPKRRRAACKRTARKRYAPVKKKGGQR